MEESHLYLIVIALSQLIHLLMVHLLEHLELTLQNPDTVIFLYRPKPRSEKMLTSSNNGGAGEN